MNLTNGTIDINNNFLFPVDKDLSFKDIQEFIKYHQDNFKPKYLNQLDKYNADISFDSDGKNHLIVNMQNYLVNTLNGFFVGIEPTIKIKNDKNDAFQNWLSEVSFADELSELAKKSSINGRVYLLVYQNEKSDTKVALVPAYEGFMIYDDTIEHKPIAFIRYAENKDRETVGTIYYSDSYKPFEISNGSLKAGESQNLVYKGHVPAIEFFDNEERTSLTSGVDTLIDALNETLSNKKDDVDYFADAYLAILGAEMSEEEQTNIKDNRLINLFGNDADKINAFFLEKPNADATQEHLIDRVTNLIFQISMVANINDEVFGNATSGRSLEYKLLSMRNLTSNKERKFTQQLRKVFEIVNSIKNFTDNISQDIEFQFTRNLPNNNADEADTAAKLNGLVSQETLLSTLSAVKDPKDEMDKIAKETSDRTKRAIADSGNELDFQKSNTVDGRSDGEN
ncbi:hypothetical protein RD055328_08440 [Companilactobacillus sp. RD055328]|uniref:phage portal protein n=1 Tax=Companilactobacillus sp. RD055328 TaxID=2916634 RepID=UPI001FC81663|nr:phage portal protein [Companilactobacillus sp. RD055328]GKQ42921.1 hypothetical protein RD055328_08440 [Companilactobacillus sp. RD055328]